MRTSHTNIQQKIYIFFFLKTLVQKLLVNHDLIMKMFNPHQDASTLNAICLHMSLFTNRLNETGQNAS